MLTLIQLTQTVGDTANAPWTQKVVPELLQNLMLFMLFGGPIIIFATLLIILKLLAGKEESLGETLGDNFSTLLTGTAGLYVFLAIVPLIVMGFSSMSSHTIDAQHVQQQLKTHDITIEDQKLTSAITRSTTKPSVINAVKDGEVVQLTISSAKSKDTPQGNVIGGDYLVTWELN